MFNEKHFCENKEDLRKNPVIYFKGSDTWRTMGIRIRNVNYCPHCGIRLLTRSEKSELMRHQKDQAYFRSRRFCGKSTYEMMELKWDKNLLDEIIEILDNKNKKHLDR